MTTHTHSSTPRRHWRRYAAIFFAALVAGTLGLAAASGWLLIPDQGNGHAYGKGKHPGNGGAVSTIDYTVVSDPALSGYDLGPGETGDHMLLQLHNPNPIGVTVTDVLTQAATRLVTPADLACSVGLTNNGDQATTAVTVHAMTGMALHINANADAAPLPLVVDTGLDFPSCFADSLMQLGPLTVKAHN